MIRFVSMSLNSSAKYSKLLKAMARNGFPQQILQLLQNPSSYKITKVSTHAGAEPSSESSFTSNYFSMDESNASMESSLNTSMESSLNTSRESSLNTSMESLSTFRDKQHNQFVSGSRFTVDSVN